MGPRRPTRAPRPFSAAVVTLSVTFAVTGFLAAGCGQTAKQPANPSGSAPAAASTGGPSPAGTRQTPAVAHIFLILMENHSASQIIGSSEAPFINSLARQYALATDYSALFHPSLPNYIALTSGSNQGITDDRSPPTAGYAVDATNIADRIEASGRTWKAYAESMPSPGFASSDTALYATRHVPFLYYKDILDNAARLKAHVVPLTQLAPDLASVSTTPDYAFITPNLCNDMHDCSVGVGDKWLSRIVPLILGSPAFTSTPSLLVITWDEGTGSDNHVATIVAGTAAKRGYQSSTPYDHYSLLHTIEAVWGLRPLTANDAHAATMDALLKQ
jgi:phosphatidylinositol-3-phosphatase